MIRQPGEPSYTDIGPWCPCGEYRARSVTTRECPVCLDVRRLELKAAQAGISKTRFANIWTRSTEGRDVA